MASCGGTARCSTRSGMTCSSRLARPGDSGVTSIANVGGAEIQGHRDRRAVQHRRAHPVGIGTYLDAKITTDFCDVAGCTPEGTRLPIQPKFKVNASARYTFPIGDADAFVQAGLLHQSGTHCVPAGPGCRQRRLHRWLHHGRFLCRDRFRPLRDRGVHPERVRRARRTQPEHRVRDFLLRASYYRVYPVRPQLFGIKLSYRFGE